MTDTVLTSWIKTHRALLCAVLILFTATFVVRFATTRTVTKTVTVVEFCRYDGGLLGMSCN